MSTLEHLGEQAPWVWITSLGFGVAGWLAQHPRMRGLPYALLAFPASVLVLRLYMAINHA
ncbi:hypothetical protein [Thiocystis violacea]|uniref:hypothetical protein n=1 Tax=Thiocystis violacea TaxID=13725 RepID=UPI0019070DDC|nr:hypothetical protein [Thiocystis violacea]